MLISPPFLLPREADQTEDQWLDTEMTDWLGQCMTGNAPGQGAYPVSYLMGWHGGSHLRAPWAGTQGHESVRAIADGTIVLARVPVTKPNPVPDDHALNYGGWTDDGAIVIRHTTEIGEGEQAQVTFFSIYMHLSAFDARVKVGARIRRKDALGKAGQICGMAGRQIHFEIGCDDANLVRLVGRSGNDLPLDRNGRTDALYGEVYYRLPGGTSVWKDAPTHGQSPPEAHAITVEDLIVGIRHSQGDAWVCTYRADGSALGEALREVGADYALYEKANSVSRAYRTNPPTPSAVFELMRLGRVLSSEPVPTAPHWRRVRCNEGQFWVNLNATNVHRYSDADFPPWKGWCLIDEANSLDSRCRSATITGWLDRDHDGHVDPQEGTWALADNTIAVKLAKTICKFPSEWDAATIEARWGYLKSPNDEMPEPMNDASFAEFTRHVQALSFWTADIGLPSSYWRFSPREFIRHFRRCRWLSREEVVQLVPDFTIRTSTANHLTMALWEQIQTDLNGLRSVAELHRIPLSRMLRKYGIDTATRQASFFGNAIQETSWLGSLAEGRGATLWYAPWYGRGFLQLTNPENYCNYWAWRGREVNAALRTSLIQAYSTIASASGVERTNERLRDAHFPTLNAEIVEWRQNIQSRIESTNAEDFLAPADSAGFYWVKNRMAQYADEAHILDRQTIQTSHGEKFYYRSMAFWRTSASVNFPGAVNRTNYSGLNGFDSRCCAYGVALAVLGEVRFPDHRGQLVDDFPCGYVARKLP